MKDVLDRFQSEPPLAVISSNFCVYVCMLDTVFLDGTAGTGIRKGPTEIRRRAFTRMVPIAQLS